MADLVDRSAFLYLEPKKGNEKEFAQCGTCRLFVPGPKGSGGEAGETLGRCVIHGSYVDIDEDDSCGFYVPWPTPGGVPIPKVVADHKAELEKGIQGSVTAVESGLVDREVQCHRCRFAEVGATRCGLYVELNKKMPDKVLLNPKIEPHACCNAQMPIEVERRSPARGIGRKRS